MLHALLTGVAVVLACLSIGIVGLWIRSYWVFDLIERSPEPGMLQRYDSITIFIDGGALHFRRDHFYRPNVTAQNTPRYAWHWDHGTARRDIYRGWPTIEHNREAIRYTSVGMKPDMDHGVYIAAGMWFYLLVLAPFPVFWFWWLLRRLKVRPGCCAVCGYDLRATPDRCPECGAAARTGTELA